MSNVVAFRSVRLTAEETRGKNRAEKHTHCLGNPGFCKQLSVLRKKIQTVISWGVFGCSHTQSRLILSAQNHPQASCLAGRIWSLGIQWIAREFVEKLV